MKKYLKFEDWKYYGEYKKIDVLLSLAVFFIIKIFSLLLSKKFNFLEDLGLLKFNFLEDLGLLFLCYILIVFLLIGLNKEFGRHYV